jgi:hypothetical protein
LHGVIHAALHWYESHGTSVDGDTRKENKKHMDSVATQREYLQQLCESETALLSA